MAQRLHDVQPFEVSLVKRGANRRRFLLWKSGDVEFDETIANVLDVPAANELDILAAVEKAGGDDEVRNVASAVARSWEALPSEIRKSLGRLLLTKESKPQPGTPLDERGPIPPWFVVEIENERRKNPQLQNVDDDTIMRRLLVEHPEWIDDGHPLARDSWDAYAAQVKKEKPRTPEEQERIAKEAREINERVKKNLDRAEFERKYRERNPRSMEEIVKSIRTERSGRLVAGIENAHSTPCALGGMSASKSVKARRPSIFARYESTARSTAVTRATSNSNSMSASPPASCSECSTLPELGTRFALCRRAPLVDERTEVVRVDETPTPDVHRRQQPSPDQTPDGRIGDPEHVPSLPDAQERLDCSLLVMTINPHV